MIYEYTVSLQSTTHVSLHVQDIEALCTEWPVRHWSYVCVYINNWNFNYWKIL